MRGFVIVSLALMLSAQHGAAQGKESAAADETLQPQFTLKLALDAGPIGLENATLRIVWTNVSTRDIRFQRAPVEQLFWIDLRDEAGTRPPASNAREGQDRELRVGGGPLLRIPPGESVTFRVHVSDAFRLGGPGRYTVQVHRTDDRTKSVVHSNTIVLRSER
jgi:hypothetical protein